MRLSALLISVFLCTGTLSYGKQIPAVIRDVTGINSTHIQHALKKKTLTLFDLYSLAVNKNENLLISREMFIRAQEKKKQAIGAFLPRVSVRGSMIYPDNSNYTGAMTGISLYARQPIITGLNEFAAYRGSKREIEMTKYLLGSNSTVLLMECTDLFFSILKIESQLRNKEEVLNLYQKTLGVLQRRVALGRSRRSELLRVNTEIYRVTAELKSLQGNLLTARHMLSVISGIDNKYPLVKPEGLADAADVSKGVEKIIDERWDIRMLKESVEIAKLKVLAAKGEHLPSLYLEGAYRLYRKDRPSRDYYGALGVELPVFSGGITNSRIREASSVRKEAELLLSRNTRNLKENIIDRYKQWVNTREELEAFKKAYESAQANFDSVNREYRLNLVTLLDVFDALTALQRAKDDYEQTVLKYSYNRIRFGIDINEYMGSRIEKLKSGADITE